MKNKFDEKEYLTVADVQCWLNISQASAYELTRRKDFPVCRFGRCIRVPREAFLAWVDMKTHIPVELVSYMKSA